MYNCNDLFVFYMLPLPSTLLLPPEACAKGCFGTPSVWDWSSNLGKDGLWPHPC